MRPTSQPDELVLIQQQVEKLSNECKELTAAFGRARRVRMGLMLAVVAFLVIASLAFYRLGSGLMKDEYTQELSKVASKRLEKNQDRYMRHVEMLVHNTSPALTDAFTKQANKDTAVYLGLVDRERDAMAAELKIKLEKKLQQRYEQSLDQHEKILEAEFPTVKDKVLHDRMTKNLHVAVDRMLDKYYVRELEQQLQQLFAAWDRFPAADLPRKGEMPLEEQFSAELYHLLTIKLGSTQAVGR